MRLNLVFIFEFLYSNFWEVFEYPYIHPYININVLSIPQKIILNIHFILLDYRHTTNSTEFYNFCLQLWVVAFYDDRENVISLS